MDFVRSENIAIRIDEIVAVYVRFSPLPQGDPRYIVFAVLKHCDSPVTVAICETSEDANAALDKFIKEINLTELP